MADDKKQYQYVFKATSLFGGVQLIEILLAVVKSKVVALFLGPAGFGVLRLLKSTVNLMASFSGFGLPASAIKFISQEFTQGNTKKAYRLIKVFKNLIWLSGLLGGILIIVTSAFISRLLFDSDAYTFSFIWLAAAVLFRQLTKGQLSILQSLRKLRYLAKANLWGSALSLLVVAPLYYFFGEAAIVPAIILTAAINLFFSVYYLKKGKLPTINLSYKQSLPEGKDMLKLGFVLSLSSLLTALTAYVLQLYINEIGGVAQVGLYTAGFLILNTYGGLIFQAMAKDYYPRLAGMAHNNAKVREAVKHQAFVAVLLMAPVIVVFLGLAPQAIRLLLSAKFMGIVQMVSWGILGLLFKAVAWSMSYVIVAKGDKKVFMLTDVTFILIQLILNITGYYYGGLTGLGISFLGYYLIYFMGMYIINHKRYNFYFPKDFYVVFVPCVVFCCMAFGLTYMNNPWWRYLLLGLVTVLSGGFSYNQLNKKIDFKDWLRSLFNNKKSEK